jgi:CubicO group peptidase (beta-lactamase class C family)
VVTVLHKGKKVFEQSYGHLQYEGGEPVGTSTIYDLASVSKISATNIAVMKLYEDGLLDLEAPIGRYLPWLRGTDKDTIKIKNMLLHQSGLVAFIPFYREVTDAKGAPLPKLFDDHFRRRFSVSVTDQLFMRRRWVDTLYKRITQSDLLKNGPRYVYSDNNFILLAQVVKSLSGKSIDAYARDVFYKPMGLQTTSYLIYKKFDKRQMAPTENEKQFRQGLLWGYVHEPGAAMFGNVAGHAGLFSNASDLARLYQMLLNGGSFDGRQYLKKETVDLFTGYRSDISRRGFGFDKPEKDNAEREPEKRYPATYVSSSTFGHTGYTGTCVWVDPEKELVYIFLSNRVYPEGGENRKLLTLNIRGRIHDLIYQSLL